MDKHTSISLQIPISKRCNNNCIFCLESRQPEGVNLNRDHIEKAIRKYSYMKKVVFVTKEPTLNPLLPHYIRKAKVSGFEKIAICTNARRLSYLSYCTELLDAGLNKLIVSIHGDNAKLHDGLTRTVGSFDQTVQGMNNIVRLRQKYRVDLNTSTVLTKINYPRIVSILKFLSGFSPQVIILNVVQPRGNMKKYFSSLMPQYSKLAMAFARYYDAVKLLPQNRPPSIVFQAIPACTGPRRIRQFFGVTEAIIKPGPDASHEFKQSFFKSESCARKRKECRLCVYNINCEGVPAIYAEHFGWKEFNPVTR